MRHHREGEANNAHIKSPTPSDMCGRELDDERDGELRQGRDLIWLECTRFAKVSHRLN